MWMRSIAEWLEGLTADATVATVPGASPASTDTVEYEGRQMKVFNEVKTKSANPKQEL